MHAARRVVEKFRVRGMMRIRYRENRRNTGFDRNADQAMRMAKGKFIHLVSDEELYDANALAIFIEWLGCGACDCIYVNHHVLPGVSGDEIAVFERRPMSIIEHPKIYRSMFCLSSVIVSKKTFDSFLAKHDISKFYDTFFVFDPIYLFALRTCKRMKAYPDGYCTMPNIAYKAHLPHDYAKTFDYCFLKMALACVEEGILEPEDFKRFKYRILVPQILRGMLLYRTYIYPKIYSLESHKTEEYYSEIQRMLSLGWLGNALFWAWRRLVYSRLPFHLLYRMHYGIRRMIFHDAEMIDRFAMYEDMLSGEGKKYEVGMDRK